MNAGGTRVELGRERVVLAPYRDEPWRRRSPARGCRPQGLPRIPYTFDQCPGRIEGVLSWIVPDVSDSVIDALGHRAERPGTGAVAARAAPSSVPLRQIKTAVAVEKTLS